MAKKLPGLPFFIENIQSIWKTDIKAYSKSSKIPMKKMTTKDFMKVKPTSSKYLIDQYCYIATDGSIRVWRPDMDDFMIYDKKKFDIVYGNKFSRRVQKWFFEENEKIYDVICDIHKPRIGKTFINTFKGFMYETKDITDFNEKVIESGKLFLTFIKEVICSNKVDQYEYVCKWIGNMLNGNKNDSCLYLRGEQGIGKSTFSDMIRRFIVGDCISIVSGSDPLRTPYNYQLLGKILVVFEELPTFSVGEWTSVSSKLKNMITGNVETYNDKYVKPMSANNINNYILNSNNNAIKDDDGRRYCILDLSTHRKGDYEYFSKIKDDCFKKDVGEYLFNYFSQLLDVEEKWNAQKNTPITANKLDAVVERLDPAFQFIKNGYIKNKIPLKMTLKASYDQYILYCSAIDHHHPLTKFKFNNKMKDIGIVCKKSGGQFKFNVTYSDLKKIAHKNKWIHELDDEFSDYESDEE